MQYELFADTDFKQETPFTDRVVCALGSFTLSSRALQERLLAMGADFKASTKVSRNVHFVLKGRGAPQDQLEYLQTLAFNGYCPRVLEQPQLNEILAGHYADYFVSQKIQKQLHLTMQHYLQFQVDYSGGLNPLYTKELYVSPDTRTPQTELFQRLGDRGIYANPYIDETTDVLVISDKTLSDLEAGRSNEVLRYIEETYNKSKAQSYRFVMTSESRLLAFLSSFVP